MARKLSREITLFSLQEAARRRKLHLILPAVLLTVGFAYYAYELPDLYRSQVLITARPMATVQDYVNASGEPHGNHLLNIEEQLQQARQTLFSGGVLETLVEERGLSGDRATAAIEDLRSRVQVDLQQENALHEHSEPTFVSFYVSVQGRSPEEVRETANRLGELFVERASAARGQRVEQVASFIDSELNQVRQRLERQDEAIQQYKRQAVQELPDRVATNLRMLESLQDELLRMNEAVANDENRRASILAEMSELENQGALETTTTKSPNRAKLDELRVALNGLEARYRPGYPDIVRIRGEIADLSEIVASETDGTRVETSPLYGRYVQLKGELDAVEQRLASNRQELSGTSEQVAIYRDRVEAAPDHERVLTELTRVQAITQEQYENLLARQHDASLARSFESLNKDIVFDIASVAPLPQAPYAPQRARIILLGVVAGLGLGILGAVIAEGRDTTFSNLDDLEESSSVKVLGSVPSVRRGLLRRRRSGKSGMGGGIVMLDQPHSVAAEQYQVLAMKLRQSSVPGSTVVLVTSAAGGEGKTVTAVNLALAMSYEPAHTTVLVDADLRKPRVHDYLDKHLDRKGSKTGLLNDLLVSGAATLDSDELSRVGNLAVIGSEVEKDPLPILVSDAARRAISALRERFDVVILDAPPVLPIADAHLLATLADEVVFVVRAGETPQEIFTHAIDNLKFAKRLGVVLNGVDYERSKYHYAYEYYRKNYRQNA